MAQIQVNHLSFYYDGCYDEIFKDVSFSIDTSWKLGFIGRNGKGKTTFLNLLMGKYEYRGTIISPERFEYFPFEVKDPEAMTLELVERIEPQYELWKILRELSLLSVDEGVLYRPFGTLSNGERTKVMLAVLFSKENSFLLIDEPTNHLDSAARQAVGRYLNSKTGFILVSHDRTFLDACIDHVLALNRSTVEVVQGNFSSWWENKKRRDEYEALENVKLKKEIGRLKEAARQAENWSDNVEKTKFGTRVGGLKPDRGAIGHKAAKMMKRAKNAENRIGKAAEEKEKLLKDVEETQVLKILPLRHHKDTLVTLENVTLAYACGPRGPQDKMNKIDKIDKMDKIDESDERDEEEDKGKAVQAGEKNVCEGFSLELRQGERTALMGRNGSGKSTVLLAVLEAAGETADSNIELKSGRISTAAGLQISYVAQDTSWLTGPLSEFTCKFGLDDTLFRSLLRKLDFSREQFDKEMQYFSEGQKKKVLLARSLCEKAHLYIWDEPLNFIDVFSRMQIEELIETHNLTMLFVEHDQTFVNRIATRKIRM